jgi:hypothetical protein
LINENNIKSILALFDISYLLGTDPEFIKNLNKFDDPEKLEDFVLKKANTISQSKIMYTTRQSSILERAGNMLGISTGNYSFILPLTKRMVNIIK